MQKPLRVFFRDNSYFLVPILTFKQSMHRIILCGSQKMERTREPENLKMANCMCLINSATMDKIFVHVSQNRPRDKCKLPIYHMPHIPS